MISGGNFSGGHVALAMDSLKTALASLADLIERQLAFSSGPRRKSAAQVGPGVAGGGLTGVVGGGLTGEVGGGLTGEVGGGLTGVVGGGLAGTAGGGLATGRHCATDARDARLRAATVAWPTTPFGARLTQAWNAFTADSVAGPKFPSTPFW